MTESIIPANILMLGGINVSKLDKTTKMSLAIKITELLEGHKDHMLQFSPEDLIENFMNTGDAVVIIDEKTGELIGFAKNFLWAGVNESGQQVYEFGSWIVHPNHYNRGFGHQLVALAVQTAKQKDSNAQIVAVCALNNPKPIGILQEMGGVISQKPSNIQILLGEGETPVNIIDMSNINFKNKYL